jgi:hypothetical protein
MSVGVEGERILGPPLDLGLVHQGAEGLGLSKVLESGVGEQLVGVLETSAEGLLQKLEGFEVAALAGLTTSHGQEARGTRRGAKIGGAELLSCFSSGPPFDGLSRTRHTGIG